MVINNLLNLKIINLRIYYDNSVSGRYSVLTTHVIIVVGTHFPCEDEDPENIPLLYILFRPGHEVTNPDERPRYKGVIVGLMLGTRRHSKTIEGRSCGSPLTVSLSVSFPYYSTSTLSVSLPLSDLFYFLSFSPPSSLSLLFSIFFFISLSLLLYYYLLPSASLSYPYFP